MSQILSPVLKLLGGEPAHWCPGCTMLHLINVGQSNKHTGARWSWNGDANKPTFSPSVKVTYRRWVPPATAENMVDPSTQTPVEVICHYFIRNGRIEFCSDTTHEFSGKTIDLPPLPVDEVEGE